MAEASWDHLKVLIVDDEVFIRGFVRRLLKVIGITDVEEAEDGATALSKFEVISPDLVILDIMMTPMNGLQVLKTVRVGMTGAPFDIPVIILTGSADGPVMGAAMALDCDAFIRKDVKPDQIKERITRVLSGKAAALSEGDYVLVKLPDVEKPVSVTPKPQPVAALSAAECEVHITEVQTGAVVARDVMTDEGSTLIHEGTLLTASHLGRLKDLSEIIDLETIWVKA